MTDLVYGQAQPIMRDPILPRWWQSVDRWTMASVFFLYGLGIILAFAASPPLAERNELHQFHYAQWHMNYGVVAMGVMLFTSVFSVNAIRRWASIGFAFAFAAIMLLPLFGVDHGKGAVRWFSIMGISLQPSELLKPVFVVFSAWLISAKFIVTAPPGPRISFVLTAVVAFLLAMQPDFGQAMLVLFAWGVMIFVAGTPLLPILALGGATALAGLVAYNKSEHFARRIDGFLTADVDPTTQLGIAARAIGEGGVFGAGAGEGSVKWDLPDAHTDFIIAVAAEEYGLVIIIPILVLFSIIVLRSFMRLMHEKDMFVRLAGTGLVTIFGAQALINMGVAVRLLPAKGMTLPFISYGGSSLVASGLTIGMILALTKSRPQGTLVQAFRGSYSK